MELTKTNEINKNIAQCNVVVFKKIWLISGAVCGEFFGDRNVVYQRDRVCVSIDRLRKKLPVKSKYSKLDGGGVMIAVQ